MDANEYQVAAARTLLGAPEKKIAAEDLMLMWVTFGLAGEAGEVVEHVKKGVFHRHGINDENLRKEVGDCLWYLAGICTVRGYDLGAIMEENIEKLRERYPNGFSSRDSRRRNDMKIEDRDEV